MACPLGSALLLPLLLPLRLATMLPFASTAWLAALIFLDRSSTRSDSGVVVTGGEARNTHRNNLRKENGDQIPNQECKSGKAQAGLHCDPPPQEVCCVLWVRGFTRKHHPRGHPVHVYGLGVCKQTKSIE